MEIKELSNLFYERRVLQRMRVNELAARSGVAASTISRLEKGESARVSLDVVMKLARVLGIKLSDLWPDEDRGGS